MPPLLLGSVEIRLVCRTQQMKLGSKIFDPCVHHFCAHVALRAICLTASFLVFFPREILQRAYNLLFQIKILIKLSVKTYHLQKKISLALQQYFCEIFASLMFTSFHI